jgi:hypothetical protein
MSRKLLLPNIPTARFWAVSLYEAENASDPA